MGNAKTKTEKTGNRKEDSQVATKKVTASNKGLSSIPKDIISAKDAEEIWLNENAITELPDGESYWERAKLIYLNENKISQLPSKIIQNWTQLEEINISSNEGLNGLPIEVKYWTKLTQVYMNKIPIVTLPEEIGCWTCLRVLHINDTNTKVIYLQLCVHDLRFVRNYQDLLVK